MGSIGIAQRQLTMKALNPDSWQSKTFVQLFNAILKENDIPIQKSERYQNGRIRGIGGVRVLQDGVAIERTASKITRGVNAGEKDEVIAIRGNGFLDKTELQRIADAIKESETYKHGRVDNGIRRTNVYIY